MRTPSHLTHVVGEVFLLLVAVNLGWGQDSNLFIVVNNESSSDDGLLTKYTTTGDACECNVMPGSETYLRFENESSRVERCLEDDISFLDVCNRAYQGDNHSLTISDTNDTGDGVYEDKATLCRILEETRTYLFQFEVILDQTLVCVYIESCKNKTQCLVCRKLASSRVGRLRNNPEI